MLRLLTAAGLLFALGACVTNVTEKAADQCAPMRSNVALYSDCTETVAARMRAKNRNTMRILAAGLGGAASAGSNYSAPPTGAFYQRDFTSGTNKVCVYRTVRGDEYVTIPATQLCPLAR